MDVIMDIMLIVFVGYRYLRLDGIIKFEDRG